MSGSHGSVLAIKQRSGTGQDEMADYATLLTQTRHRNRLVDG